MSKKTSEAKEKNLNLSVSAVEAFQSCQAKWHYRYVVKLPTPPPTYHLTAGSFIHKILEIFLRRYKKSKDLNDAARVAFNLAKKDEDLSPHLTKEILEEGKAWLKQIVSMYETSPETIPNVLSIEAPFSFKIGSDITVRGFIDRIDEVDFDTIKIVDYKTSSNPDYLTSFQLATYAIAANKKYPGKQIQAAYSLVRHGFSNKNFQITETEKEDVISTFEKVAYEIRTRIASEGPWETNVTKLCSYCPYRVRCETDRNKKSPWKIS